MKKILMSILALGVMSSSVYGDCRDLNHSGGAVCTNVKVKELFPTNYGRIYFTPDGNLKKFTQCKTHGKWVYIHRDDKGKKEMFATLLSAQRADEKVNVYFAKDKNGECYLTGVILSM